MFFANSHCSEVSVQKCDNHHSRYTMEISN